MPGAVGARLVVLEVQVSEELLIWTIYERPRDELVYRYVARMFAFTAGKHRPTPTVMKSDDIEALREEMRRRGLTCLGREEADEPHIVETWM